jgi:hypothetical protein
MRLDFTLSFLGCKLYVHAIWKSNKILPSYENNNSNAGLEFLNKFFYQNKFAIEKHIKFK